MRQPLASVKMETLSSSLPHASQGSASGDAVWWFILAVVSLAVAGAFSLVLVIGRIPNIGAIIIPDAELARRSLVVHVNLAISVWFFSSLAGFFCLLPGRRCWNWSRLAVVVAVVGVVLQVIPVFSTSATPILSNYVPVLDHPVFLTGWIIFVSGVLLQFLDLRLIGAGRFNSPLSPGVRVAIRSGAVVFMLALVTMVGALVNHVPNMNPVAYYEYIFWGGGHVLQAASALGMLGAWMILLEHLTDQPVLGRASALILCALIVLPVLPAPWLTFGGYAEIWFTRMMQYGLFPAALILMGLGIMAVRHRMPMVRQHLQSPALGGLISSVILTLVGFVLGAMIVADTTLTPAHYHANIGAVTIAYMTVMMILLPRLGMTIAWPRLARWQPLIYAIGQMLFVLGLAVAGTLGNAPRKTYGSEQRVLDTAERIGLAIVGVGGLLALAGGILFIVIMINAFWHSQRNKTPATTLPRP